jgi:hypothetical protein
MPALRSWVCPVPAGHRGGMSARRALLVVPVPGRGGKVRAGGSRAGGGGREGRPAVLVWFHGRGRAGAPPVGLRSAGGLSPRR